MLEPVEPVRLLPLGYTQVFSRRGRFMRPAAVIHLSHFIANAASLWRPETCRS